MVLELSNPPANTDSNEMLRQLDKHILDARFDPAVQVLLITGAGDKFFCAGRHASVHAPSLPRGDA